jgi:DNA polymerase elongation subunit (family B)
MRILTLDIETVPHLSFHWGRWQQNIPASNTVSESRIVCFAAKWHDSNKMMFYSEWGSGKEDMLVAAWDLLDKADLVVGYNSKKFDVKRLNAEFAAMGMTPPSPYHHVDLYHQVKKNFAFSSNKLKDVLNVLGLSPKMEEDVNWQLWLDVYNGRKPAQKKMAAYNKQDVKSTEELYDYLLGWIQPHPNWGLYVDDLGPDRPTCPSCGSHDMVKHKIRTTRVRRYRQWKCKACGSYHRGRKHLDGRGKEDTGVLN